MTVCVSCSGQELVYSHNYLYRSSLFERIFPDLAVYRCNSCGLFQVDHAVIDPTKLLGYYQRHYRREAGIALANTAWDREILRERGLRLAQCARKFSTSTEVKRIFEVGAGYGANLKAMREVFPAAELFTDEVDKKALDASIQQCDLDDGPFDVVVLSHVLEHFTFPKDLIDKVVENLTDSGILIVEVPNEGPEFVCQASFHKSFHEPHLTFFKADSLADFFNRNFSTMLGVVQLSSAGARIADVVERRGTRYPRGILSGLQTLLRQMPFFENVARQIYCFAVYHLNKPEVDYSDDLDVSERLYLRIVLRKSRSQLKRGE